MIGPWRTGAALIAAAAMLSVSGTALTQPAPPQPDYHPSLADLMTMAVQPRHTKLGLGGRARNWSYAAYEASELRNAFRRIARTIPVFGQTDLAGMFDANVKDPLDRIDAAVKARDGARFDAAYADLTKACNTCHQGMGKPFVVIRQPGLSPYPDQSFQPPR
jgi:hypothetical protein